MDTVFPLCGMTTAGNYTKAEWEPLLDMCSGAEDSVKFHGSRKEYKVRSEG